MEDPDGIPGSWLQPGSALAMSAIWRTNQRMEEYTHSLFYFAPQINKSFIKKVSPEQIALLSCLYVPYEINSNKYFITSK